jgi:predicted metal-dependent enzyme (double-stranded beta helix superfamily)
MPEQYSIAQYVDDLRRITAQTVNENELFNQIGPLAKRLASEDNWIEERFYEPDEETGFSAFLLHEEKDHSDRTTMVHGQLLWGWKA